jgi:hypothetical protein
MMIETDLNPAMCLDQAIVRCSTDAVTPGKLGKCFQDGAKAVLLDDPRAVLIWKQMVDLSSPSQSLGSEIISAKK